MLDVIGNEAALGKRVGSDYSKKKASYPAVFGMEESQRLMLGLSQAATKRLLPKDCPIRSLVRY